ncbi:MAG: hypothetical protein J6X88_04870 [Bacteroidales bacterium]|nr:hypothetical protein [Bacteroidales bacterium]
MFEVEKPRRFHYEPRFYDPEKEKWEALKKKYAIEKEKEDAGIRNEELGMRNEGTEDGLEYFERRVRDLDRKKREASSRLTWRDLFRRREMPKFQYTPRFSGTTEPVEIRNEGTEEAELVQKYSTPRHKIKIRRRFDIGDTDYMKPIPGTKIILYTGIVCLLLAIIFLF